MKALRKSMSLILSLALVLSCMLTAYPVFAEEVAPVDVVEDYAYNAVEDFSTENGNPNGVWKYQYRNVNEPNTYYDMTLSNGNWVAPGGGNFLVAAGNQVTTATDPTLRFFPNNTTEEVVLTFTAPKTGIINVSIADGGIFAPYNSEDGIRFEMIHNGVVVESKYDLDNAYNPNGNRYFTGTKAMSVKEGDTIRFVVGRNKHIDSRTFCVPKIAYAKVCEDTVFNAYDDFSLEANPNGVWSYYERTSAAGAWEILPAGGTIYGDGGTPGGFITTTTSDLVTGKASLKMSPNGNPWAVSVMFTAPYTGKINIKMANGGVFAPQTASTHSMTFEMKHNDTTSITGVKNLNGTNNTNRYFTDVVTLDVKAGDTVRFIVGKVENAGTTFNMYFNPEISYTDITMDTFNPVTDYSTTTNPNGVWKYQFRSSASAAFNDMIYNAAAGFWADINSIVRLRTNPSDLVAGGPVMFFQVHDQGPESVLTFTAPYSGNINVKMLTGGVYAPHQSSDGVTFTLLHNGTVVEQVTDLDNSYNTAGSRFFADTKSYTVKAGDTLNFCVRRNVGVDGTTYFNPEISYTSITEPEAELGKAYYISSSTGNDSYSGTNPNSAWSSFAKLADLPLGEHDKVYLKAGDTWNEQLVLNSVNGTEDNPVVITSYGDGEQPKIDLGLVDDPATKTSEVAVPVVVLTNAEGIEINNLAITGSGVGIDFHYKNDLNNKYIKVKNCTFTDLTGFHQKDNRERPTADRYYVATGITVTLTNNSWAVTDPAIIGLYIEDCVTDNCGALYCPGGSHLETNEGSSRMVNGLYIKDCKMYDNDYYGLFISSVNGGYMDGCIVDGCGAAEHYTPGTAGILLAAKNFSIINTEISFQQRGGVDYDGVAIDFEQGCDNVTVENCYMHDNTGAGFLIYDSTNGAAGANRNCTIKNNIFAYNATEAKGNTILHNDKIVDIRIVSNSGYSLSGSTISDNVYINDREGYEFIQDDQALTPDVPNVFENNVAADTEPEWNVSEELTAATAAVYDGWNVSEYSADVRKGYAAQNGLLMVTDTFRHLLATSADTNWFHQYFRDGKWNDMTVNSEKSWGDDTNGAIWSNNEITAVSPAQRGLVAIGFTAPKSGRIRISLEQTIFLRQANPGSDGVYVTIANENKELLCDPIHVKAENANGFAGIIPAFYYNATAGEKIYIMISKVEHTMYDSTRITPMVEYVNAFGSINADSEMDIRDLIALKSHMADESFAVTEFADINGDGAVASADSVLLRRYLLGAFAQ